MTDFRQIISSKMRELSKDDSNGALPYLLLTSKSESVVRDLLAFLLHIKVSVPKCLCCSARVEFPQESEGGTEENTEAETESSGYCHRRKKRQTSAV